MTYELEQLIEGYGFRAVSCTGLETVELEEGAFVLFSVYLSGEAGPYRFHYPIEASLPVVVTRSDRTLLIGKEGKAFIALKPAPDLPALLVEHGCVHYADERSIA